jgi:hypothetical protein
MKRMFLVGVVAATCACGRPETPPQSNAATEGAAGAAADARPPAGGSAAAPQQTVTLVGCLQGPPAPDATNTSTRAARERARRNGPDSAVATSGQGSNGPFVLADATPASPESAGTGANGAGGSGGPLVSGTSTFELDAVSAEARAHVNKQVRITGRLDATQLSGGGSTSASAGDMAPGGAATSAGTNGSAGSPSSGASASAGSPGGSIGAPGSGSTVGGRSGTDRRRLKVESIQVVAETCASAAKR